MPFPVGRYSQKWKKVILNNLLGAYWYGHLREGEIAWYSLLICIISQVHNIQKIRFFAKRQSILMILGALQSDCACAPNFSAKCLTTCQSDISFAYLKLMYLAPGPGIIQGSHKVNKYRQVEKTYNVKMHEFVAAIKQHWIKWIKNNRLRNPNAHTRQISLLLYLNSTGKQILFLFFLIFFRIYGDFLLSLTFRSGANGASLRHVEIIDCRCVT